MFTQSIQEVEKIKDEVEAVNAFGGRAKLIESQDIELNKLNSAELVETKEKN